MESHEYRSDRLNGYALNSLDIMRQTACLVINPIIVDGYASLFNFTTAVRSLRLNDGLIGWLGLDDMSLAWLAVVQLFFIYSGTQ